ncbi:glycosyltransferase [Dyella caseinilytica]|uniref:Glycosyltransferase family 1 protein n=1 Tax=Dyella caseinilytica TaxID=1849581 RepID=A0ABX7GX39_9GAMM|nr:glycosyltransferase [Dyella caseinilytica]QRN54583.1 glycosyltransferase family 1 protein [Dyella caseinilytica]GFZ95392.1 glucosyltransferase [Dyella caseinilytica]
MRDAISHGAPIAIFTIGTQGDIRPCVALGVGLQRAGYPVRIVTSDNFEGMVRAAGLDFYPLTANFQTLLDSNREIADQGLDMSAMARISRRFYAEWATHWAREGMAAAEGAGLLIGVANSTLLAKAVSEARGIPFVGAQLQPLTPSRFMPPLVLSGAGKLPPALNMTMYNVLRLLVWHVMKPAINNIVRPQLGLPRYPWYGPYFNNRQHRVLYGFSRHVVPRPADWPPTAQITGYWFLDQPEWQPSQTLREFLDAGSKPIYVGFGSMVSTRAEQFTASVLDAVRRSGQRAVLATGWGGLAGNEGTQDGQLYFTRSVPHDWLFPRMSAAVHHGGAGTTAAAVRAGIPSVIVPFFGDQPFWARCLQREGVAPAIVDRRNLQAEALAEAIDIAGKKPMCQAAVSLGQKVRAEDGVEQAITSLRQWGLLEPLHDERETREAWVHAAVT